MSEPARRVHLFTLVDLHTYTTKPADGDVSGANVVENKWNVIGPDVYRFDVLEVDVLFDAPLNDVDIVVVPFLSRLNPTGQHNPQVETKGDSWGSYGPQTAYGNPLLQDGGNRIRIETGAAKYLALCARSGGDACDAEVYGIVLFPGTR